MTEIKKKDDRVIQESGTDAKIANHILPFLQEAGFRLICVRFFKENSTLQVMAERESGTMTLKDCAELSRGLSVLFDEESPVEDSYHLEVSSPGIDRFLVFRQDFVVWKGHNVKATTRIALSDQKNFKGRIMETEESGVFIEIEKKELQKKEMVFLPFKEIIDIKLIPEDSLIRSILRENQNEIMKN